MRLLSRLFFQAFALAGAQNHRYLPYGCCLAFVVPLELRLCTAGRSTVLLEYASEPQGRSKSLLERSSEPQFCSESQLERAPEVQYSKHSEPPLEGASELQ